MAGKGITTGGSYGAPVGDVEGQIIDQVQRRTPIEPAVEPVVAPQLPTEYVASPLAQSLASQGYDVTPQEPAAPIPFEQVAQQAADELAAPAPATLDAPAEVNVEQAEREAVAPLSQRATLAKAEPAQAAFDRAVNVTKVFDEAAAGPTIPVKLRSKSAFTAGDTDTAYRGDLSADRLIFDPNNFNAGEIDINGQSRVNPMFGAVAGMVTENFFRNSGVQDGQAFFGNEFEESAPEERVLETPKAKDNQKLGRQIWEEWMRERALLEGQDPALALDAQTRPPQAPVLAAMGGLAKEAYAAANPDLVTPVRGVGEGDQTTYIVNPKGIQIMDDAYKALNRPFESHEIPPLNAPSPTAQPEYQAGHRAKAQTTATGIKRAGPRIAEAKKNYHDMKRVLQSGREKIFYAQLAPAILASFEAVQPAVITDSYGRPSFDPAILNEAGPNLYADAYKIGPSRAAALVQQKQNQIVEIQSDIAEAQAKHADKPSPFTEKKIEALREQLKQAEKFSPALVYKADVLKALESMNTSARYSNQIFHNTFGTQMLTGRLGIQQNKLNPQNNTMLRFVAGSPNLVSINPKASDAVSNNFRETIAAHFLNGGTDLKPHRRIEAFSAWKNNRPFLIGDQEFNGKVSWADAVAAGKEIKAWINSIDVDTARAQLSELQVDTSLPLGEILGPLAPLAQQPALSEKTLNTIERIAGKKKGETPYITDWLAAIADFDNGVPFSTPIEVEVDGITHGISSNALALGLESGAFRGGVINPHPDLKLTALPVPIASTEVEGLTYMQDGSMHFEVTPRFEGWLKNRVDKFVRPDVKADIGIDESLAVFSNEVVEWLLTESGVGEKVYKSHIDYKDKDGNNVDVKLVRAGQRQSNYSENHLKGALTGEKPDFIEIWEVDGWKDRRKPLKQGDSITLRPVGRLTPDQFYSTAERTSQAGGNRIGYRSTFDVSTMQPPLQLTDQPVSGDLRDAMKATMYDEAQNLAKTLITQADEKSVDALVQLAHNAIQDRDNYLKKSPMTLGYGQEIGSLKQHVRTTINTGARFKELNEIIDSTDNDIDRNTAVDYLHGLLVDSIVENMDPRVLQTAAMLRANNLLAVITDKPLYYDNGSGFRSNIASVTDLPGSAESTTFTLKDETGEPTTVRTPIYTEKYAAGSAPRTYQPGESPIPGGFGHGRSIPTVAQTYDATMLSGVASGQTNEQMKSKVKGRGYEYSWLPVFDAGKVDMAQLDLVREAMNREWYNGIRDNDYVGQIMGPGGWYDQTVREFVEEMKALPANTPIDIGPDTKWRGVHYLLNDYFGALNYVRAAIGVDGQLGDANDPDTAKHLLGRINQSLRAKGINVPFKGQQPITRLTPVQLVSVAEVWMNNLQVRRRNEKLAAEVKSDREKLFRKIKAEDVLQVDL